MGRRKVTPGRRSAQAANAKQYTPKELREKWTALLEVCAQVNELGQDPIEPIIAAMQTVARGEKISSNDVDSLMATGLVISKSIKQLVDVINSFQEMVVQISREL